MRQSVGVKLGFLRLEPESTGLRQAGLGRAGQGWGKIAREHLGWVRGGDESPACNMSPSQDTRAPGVGTAERGRRKNEWEVS